MSDQWDAFGDILESNTGIFGDADGLKAYDSVKYAYSPEGLNVEMQCRNCGSLKQVLITWPEIIALAHNVSPAEAYSQAAPAFASHWQPTNTNRGVIYAWYPTSMNCVCGGQVAPLVQPGECVKHVQQMRARGWMSRPQEQQFSAVCAQMAQQLGRR